MSPACLSCTQFFLVIISLASNLAPDLEGSWEGTSFNSRHQLWGYKGMPCAEISSYSLFSPWPCLHSGSTGILVALVLFLLCPSMLVSPLLVYRGSCTFSYVPGTVSLQCPQPCLGSFSLSIPFPSPDIYWVPIMCRVLWLVLRAHRLSDLRKHKVQQQFLYNVTSEAPRPSSRVLFCLWQVGLTHIP